MEEKLKQQIDDAIRDAGAIYDTDILRTLVQTSVDSAYKQGHEEGYKEAEKTFARLFAAITLKQGGEMRVSDLDLVTSPDWVVERYRDEKESCTVFKVFERDL